MAMAGLRGTGGFSWLSDDGGDSPLAALGAQNAEVTANGGELQKAVGQGALRVEQKSLPGKSGRLLGYWLVRQ